MSNIDDYLKKMSAHQALVLEACSKIINATALQMYKRIVDRTPIGNPNLWHPPYWPKNYIPGTLKASWNLSFNGVQRNTTGQFSSSDQLVTSGGLSLRLNSTNSNQAITISNPQPYAQRVETGWSTQAPSGMMRITVAEYTSIVDSQTVLYRIK